MRRERGASTLLLVLLLLMMSSLLRQGINRQYQTQLAQAAFESKAILESAQVDALLQWGKQQPWRIAQSIQCQQSADFSGRVCLRKLTDSTVLLSAASGSQTRWQSGTIADEKVQFNAHGWSDFCPTKDTGQCLQP